MSIIIKHGIHSSKRGVWIVNHVLLFTGGFTIGERIPCDLVPDGDVTVPRSMQRHERVTSHAAGERSITSVAILTLVKIKTQRGGVGRHGDEWGLVVVHVPTPRVVVDSIVKE